jgi:hypothetical protein
MRIERVTDIQEIMKCLPFEREIRNKGREEIRESEMLLFIQSQILNPLFGYFMAYDDEENVIGYIVAMLSLIPGYKRLHLLRIYAKKKEIMEGFEKILIEWAKPYKIRIASVTTKKHTKFYIRKYNYVPVSVNLERRYY